MPNLEAFAEDSHAERLDEVNSTPKAERFETPLDELRSLVERNPDDTALRGHLARVLADQIATEIQASEGRFQEVRTHTSLTSRENAVIIEPEGKTSEIGGTG